MRNASRSLLQITRRGVRVGATPGELARLRRTFEKNHLIRLPQLLEPYLFTAIQSRIQRSRFYTRAHPRVGVEHCMANNPTMALLEFLVNDHALFEWIRKITGSAPIGCFTGRVYRMIPGTEHYDDWHNDVIQDRMLALSINFSDGIYKGGFLQLRKKKTGEMLQEAVNVGFGDAILFRISKALEHRVTNVTGTVPKTAFAGWFRARPNYIVPRPTS